MLLTLTRRIPGANSSIRTGVWTRKEFFGAELFGKTLGVIGVGKIGREVGARMKRFGMTVLGLDPVISAEVAERLGVEKVGLDELLSRSDFITLHAPLNEQTKNLLNDETFAKCRHGVYVVNCARGGIVNEDALLRALNSGQVAGAALDVFGQEPPGALQKNIIEHPNVVSTPHIAASTSEAQEKVARQVTEQVINALEGRPVMTPVNGDAIKMATQKEVQPYLRLTEQLGKVAVQLVGGSVSRITVRCHGSVGQRYAEILTISGLKGILSQVVDQPVNYINARPIAKDSGLIVEEQRLDARGNYLNLVEVEIKGNGGGHRVSGTVFGDGDCRIVGIDSYDLEVVPEGNLLLYTNEDRPGRLASVSGILAEANINIGAVALGRKGPGLMALTVLTLDEALPDDVREQIASTEGVLEVVVIKV
jgi:D-3-phosphoglycerate dehydrogenase